MKQIVDKLNKIAKKINENVELSDRDLIIDSLDSITKAYGGTPNDSTLIVDKLDDIYNNIGSAPSGNIEITENGENINVAPYATATVNVAGGGGDFSTANVSVTFVSGASGPDVQLIYIYNSTLTGGLINVGETSDTTKNFEAVLYQGSYSTTVSDLGNIIATSGDCTYADGVLTITGDCALTVKAFSFQ